MDIGSIFLILGLLVLVAIFVGRPLLEERSAELGQQEHELSTLLAERDRLLTALEELDFDNSLGKIPEEDYPAQRAALVQRGVAILRSLDEIQAESYPDDEMRIDAALAARRAEMAALAVPAGNGSGLRVKPAPLAVGQDDDLEALIANRRRDRKEKAAGFCPACGKPLQKSDRFCPKCGQQLAG
jgi:hypothetical protein